MRILIIDNEGLALDWVLRCQQDGHKVKWFIRQTDGTKFFGRGGIADIVNDYNDWAKWADLIFFTDNSKYLQQGEAWKKQGMKVISCPPDASLWELDRSVGMAAFKKAGVPIPPFKMFTDYDAAISYVKKEMVPLVSKPNGDVDRALSYVSKSATDMVYMLERWKKLDKHKGPFMMQECIYGTEMAVGGWYGPGGFNEGWCENWEFKKLMNDDLGVATGEQGTILRIVKKSKLADMVLSPMEDYLEKLNYIGYIDVNCIIDDEGNPWPLEFTMRPGWPTFNIQQALHTGDHAQWLMDLAEGKDAKNWTYDQIAAGVVLSIPDYPYSKFTRREVVGVPIYGITPSIASSVHFNQVMMGEAPQEMEGKIVNLPAWLTAGDYVLVGSGIGDSVQSAVKSAYRVLKKISLPNSPMYRTDIGKRLKKQLPQLQSQGFAKGMSYLPQDSF
jgi:phosphoribosylamine--glycine ligase